MTAHRERATARGGAAKGCAGRVAPLLSDPTIQGNRRYTPNREFVGQDIIRYQASNGIAVSKVASLIINTLSAAGPGGREGRPNGAHCALAGACAVGPPWSRACPRPMQRTVPALDAVERQAALEEKADRADQERDRLPDRPTSLTLTLPRRGRTTALVRLHQVTVVGSVTDGAANRRLLRRAVSLDS